MKKLLITPLAIMVLALPLPASALLCVGCACTVSTSPVAFGAYAPLSGAVDLATGNVAVRCTTTLGLLVSFTIDLGTGSSGSFTPRKMASGINRLDYNLYTSSAYTSIWGDGAGGTADVGSGDVGLSLASATTVNYPVYGRIPASQKTVPPGGYSDSVVVTITF